MTRVIRIGLYLGFGALLHVVFVGSQFDWSSAWTWLWLFGWPVMLVITFWAFILSIVVFALITIGVMTLWEKL